MGQQVLHIRGEKKKQQKKRKETDKELKML